MNASSSSLATMTTPFHGSISFTPRLRIPRTTLGEPSRSASNIHDFSLPPSDRSPSPPRASSSRTPMAAGAPVYLEEQDLDSPASRLRALLERKKVALASEPITVQQHSSGPSLVESDFLSEDEASQIGHTFASSTTSDAQRSVKGLFSAVLHDTPERSKTPRRRRNGVSDDVGRSKGDSFALKGKEKHSSSEEDDMDISSGFAAPNSFQYSASSAPFATSTPPSSSHFRKSTFSSSTSQSPSQFHFMSQSNLLEQDSSMQRAMAGHSTLDFDNTQEEVLEKSYSPLSRLASSHRENAGHQVTEPDLEVSLPNSSTKTYESWSRRNREDDTRSSSSTSSRSRSRRHLSPLSSVVEARSPSPVLERPASQMSTPFHISRVSTPSTVKALPARPTTPSTARPSASRLPVSTTPSIRKQRNSATHSIEEDEKRLRKAIAILLPSSSPIPPASPPSSPPISVLPLPTRSKSPALSHMSSDVQRSAPLLTSTPQRTTVSPRLSPRTPVAASSSISILSTPSSAARRNFSPRTRTPSPSFEMENETLPLPPSSDEAGSEAEVRDSRHILDSIVDDTDGEDVQEEHFQSLGSMDSRQAMRVDSSIPLSSFTSAMDELGGCDESDQATGRPNPHISSSSTHLISPKSPKRPLQPPLTPAPPGNFIFSTPASRRKLQFDFEENEATEYSSPAAVNGYAHPGSVSTMPTPAPPGAFNNTKYYQAKRALEQSSMDSLNHDSTTNNILQDIAHEPVHRLPPETPFHNMKTPKPPGGWASAMSGTSKRGRFSVRFENAADSSANHLQYQDKIEIPDFDATGFDSKDEDFEMPTVEEPYLEGRTNRNIPVQAAENSHASSAIVTPKKHNRHRRSPSVRSVDSFGMEDTSSNSNTSSPTKKKRKTLVTMVDALGRAMPEPEDEAEPSFAALHDEKHDEDVDSSWSRSLSATDDKGSRRDATRRVRKGLEHLARDLEGLESNLADDETEKRQLEKLQRLSDEARAHRKKIENDLAAAAKSQPKLIKRGAKVVMAGKWTWKSIIGLIFIQLLIALVMFRYANHHARTLFLTTYYDTFYGNLHLFTSRSFIRETYLSAASLSSSASDAASDAAKANSTTSYYSTFIASGAQWSFQTMADILGIVELILQHFFGSTPASTTADAMSWPPT